MDNENLVRGTDDYALFKLFKQTSEGVIDRSINRTGVDVSLDSENWRDLADELDKLAMGLTNAAVLANAFAGDAREIGKAFAGISPDRGDKRGRRKYHQEG